VRVALVMEQVAVSRGGAERSTEQFLHHLLELGVEVELYTASAPPEGPGLRVHTIQPAATTRSGRSAAFARRVDQLLAAGDADVVHAISPCLRAEVYEPRGGTVQETIERNMALRRSAGSRSLKRLLSRFNLRQRLMLDLERRLLAREPRPVVVALSEYVVAQLRRHYGFPDSHIRRVFNGVDPDPGSEEQRRRDRSAVRRRYGVTEDELLVLMVAHNFKLKGVGRWIEAAGRLAGEGVVRFRSLVVGKGSASRWRKRVASAGAGDRVVFAGPVEDVWPFYHAADVLVHPTYYDPCSRVVLEAMAAGRAVVTTRFDGASDAIEEGVSGYVLDSPEEVGRLAECVSLLADAERRHRMGARALAAGAGATMRRHAERLIEVYGQVARGRAVV